MAVGVFVGDTEGAAFGFLVGDAEGVGMEVTAAEGARDDTGVAVDNVQCSMLI